MNFLFSKKCVNIKLSFAQGIKKLFFGHFLAFLGFYFVTPPCRAWTIRATQILKSNIAWRWIIMKIWRVTRFFILTPYRRKKPTFLDLTDFYFVTWSDLTLDLEIMLKQVKFCNYELWRRKKYHGHFVLGRNRLSLAGVPKIISKWWRNYTSLTKLPSLTEQRNQCKIGIPVRIPCVAIWYGSATQCRTKVATYGIKTVVAWYKNRSHLTRLGGDNCAVNVERGNAARGLYAGRGEHQQLSVIEPAPFRAPFAPPRHRSALRLEPGPVPRLLLLLIQSRLFIHFSLLNSGTVFSVRVWTVAVLCRPYFSRRCTVRRRRRGVEQDGILVLARK